jgi:hypothetical protein
MAIETERSSKIKTFTGVLGALTVTPSQTWPSCKPVGAAGSLPSRSPPGTPVLELLPALPP